MLRIKPSTCDWSRIVSWRYRISLEDGGRNTKTPAFIAGTPFPFPQRRLQGRGPGVPPALFLDQNEARRAGKNFFETGPPLFSRSGWPASHPPPPPSPYLKVWICHCSQCSHFSPTPSLSPFCACQAGYSQKRKLAVFFLPSVTLLSTMLWSRAVKYPKQGTSLDVSWLGYIWF